MDSPVRPHAVSLADAIDGHIPDRLGQSLPDSLTAERRQHGVRLQLSPSPNDN